jgi:hypothetical protein
VSDSPNMSQKFIFETHNCKLKVLTDRPNLDRLADYFLLFFIIDRSLIKSNGIKLLLYLLTEI